MTALLVPISDFLQQARAVLEYDPEKPILFTQMFFWKFFGVILLAYAVLYKNIRLRNSFLFITSIFFYYKCSGPFVFLLLFAIVLNYFLGIGIYRTPVKSIKKIYVVISITVSLVLLSYFKYTGFFVDLINQALGTQFVVKDYLSLWSNGIIGTNFDISTIILPAGISFFSFHALSYTIDLYRQDTLPAKNIIDFGFYLSFFPQLVAGPIIRASKFIPQISKPYHVSQRDFGLAIFLIVGGLIKKMVISDYVSMNFVDRVFDNPLSYSGLENLLAVYGYALQIYCDFSGYTDIAIGLSLLLGFQIPDNFRSPYKAINLTDFWRRWHISLSSWLRDYLYIPLGGNRKGKYRTYINLLVTMLLGGLWHGANWRFVIWGAIHGLGLAIDKMRPKSPYFDNHKLGKLFSVFLTFNIVSFAWIFFRATDMAAAKQMLQQITLHFNLQIAYQFITGYWKVCAILSLGFLLHWLPTSLKTTIREKFINTPIYAKVIIVIAAVLFIYQFKNSALQPFIYFQF